LLPQVSLWEYNNNYFSSPRDIQVVKMFVGKQVVLASALAWLSVVDAAGTFSILTYSDDACSADEAKVVDAQNIGDAECGEKAGMSNGMTHVKAWCSDPFVYHTELSDNCDANKLLASGTDIGKRKGDTTAWETERNKSKKTIQKPFKLAGFRTDDCSDRASYELEHAHVPIDTCINLDEARYADLKTCGDAIPAPVTTTTVSATTTTAAIAKLVEQDETCSMTYNGDCTTPTGADQTECIEACNAIAEYEYCRASRGPSDFEKAKLDCARKHPQPFPGLEGDELMRALGVAELGPEIAGSQVFKGAGSVKSFMIKLDGAHGCEDKVQNQEYLDAERRKSAMAFSARSASTMISSAALMILGYLLM
jgi:hypothetical protein